MLDTSTNLSKVSREQMVATLTDMKALHPEQTEALNQILTFVKSQKYGLNFEKHIEQVDIDLQNHLPVFKPFKQIDNGSPEDGYNFLLEGDNLHSLKLLEKTHAGAVDVIYIDPPYNTGNRDFRYTDRIIGEDDGYRHSKWLSFMTERLSIAKNLLSDTGVIFISIDEYEFAQLKLLCDGVFGEENFVENFIWVKNSTKNLSKTTSTNHEYILCYARNIECVKRNDNLFRVEKAGLSEVKDILKKATENGLSPAEAEQKLRTFYKAHPELKGISQYNRVDYGPRNSGQRNYQAYRLSDSSAPKATGRAATYEVIHPVDGKPCKTPTRGWAYTQETMQEHIRNGLIEFYSDHNHVPQFKRYLDTVETEVQKSVISDFKDGKKELCKLFGESPFGNPKPTSLVKTLLRCCSRNALVLDFFAGSGTTGQAVLELNEEDGGNRHFILCTNNEIDDVSVEKIIGRKPRNTIGNGEKIASWHKQAEEIRHSRNSQHLGICQSVTFPRINTVITGIRPDGSRYSDGIPCNLKYFQTDMVEKYEKDDDGNYLPYVSETLRADLSNYIDTLIELQDGISLPSERTAVVWDSVGIDELMEADTAKLQTVYMDLDTIETSAEQERFINRLRNHGVEFRNIPKYYYKEVA